MQGLCFVGRFKPRFAKVRGGTGHESHSIRPIDEEFCAKEAAITACFSFYLQVGNREE